MNFGFSYVVLLFLLMLMIPNLIWSKNQPKGYTAENEPKFLVACERIGQTLVTVTVLIFSDFNLKVFSLWSLWLIASLMMMLMYE